MNINWNIKCDINDIINNTVHIFCDNKIEIDISFYEYDYNTLNLLYNTTTQFDNNSFFYAINKSFFEIKILKIEITYINKIIKEYYLNFNNIFCDNKIEIDFNDIIDNKFKSYININKNISKNISIYVDKHLGLGDFMSVTPFIRKLYNSYNKKIDIYGYKEYYDFIKNNPYINNFYINSEFDLSEINKENENFTIFTDFGSAYLFSDIKQLVAKSADITLKEEELELDYVPDDYIEIENLPKDYILINPRIDSIDRNFIIDEHWQILVDLLNDINIPVVAIGVKPSQHYTDLKIKNGLNLIYDERQNSLSQTWHIINKCRAFITFDTGMYIFAGTTDANILLNGWCCDPWFHQPYRNGSKNYKFSTIRGYCPFYCTTEPRKSFIELGSIKTLHQTNVCALNINRNCVPKPNMIINKLIELKWI